jgi:hypothetical protein
MKRSFCLLIALGLLSVVMSSNLASASEGPYKANFTVASTGRCLVQYDSFFGPPLPDQPIGDYNEWESPTGHFMFAGKALTEEYTGGPPGDPYTPPGEWQVTLPGTMKATGLLKVSWSHEGVNYEIQGRVSPKSQTYGLLEPDKDWLSIKGSAGAMDFIGTYKVDTLTTPLQCACTFIVGTDALIPDSGVLLVRIQFPDWPTSVITFYWFEAGCEYMDWHIPPAVLMHQVVIR